MIEGGYRIYLFLKNSRTSNNLLVSEPLSNAGDSSVLTDLNKLPSHRLLLEGHANLATYSHLIESLLLRWIHALPVWIEFWIMLPSLSMLNCRSSLHWSLLT